MTPDPRPLRLYLASLLLVVVAGIEAFVFVVVSAGSTFTPRPDVFALGGVAAIATLLDAFLVVNQSRVALITTAVVTLYGVVFGFASAASGFGALLIPADAAIAIVVFSVTDAFPPSPDLPATIRGRLGLGLVTVLVIVAFARLVSDPLKPGDVRTPTWSGVVASAAERTLVGGGSFGAFEELLSQAPGNGDLLLAGGTPEEPTWADSYSPRKGEATCYITTDVGYDDRDAIVIVHSDGTGQKTGVRVPKSVGFDPDGVTDGRYIGLLVPGPAGRLGASDRRIAFVASDAGPDAGQPSSPARAGYFCLDATGHVTRWDRGY